MIAGAGPSRVRDCVCGPGEVQRGSVVRYVHPERGVVLGRVRHTIAPGDRTALCEVLDAGGVRESWPVRRLELVLGYARRGRVRGGSL